MSSEITSWKVLRDWILLFYSPQSHLISRLLIFFLVQVTWRILNTISVIHVLGCQSCLRELPVDLRKPKHCIISSLQAKESKISFMHPLGRKTSEIWDQNRWAGIKWCPCRTQGNWGGVWEDHKVTMQQEGFIFFLFVFLGVFCHPSAIEKIRLEMRRNEKWEVGAALGSPSRKVGSILQWSTEVVGWSHELIEHHEGQIHKNILLANNPEVCGNSKFNLEL